jgi:ABC-type uncharacterized transport system substrate-binding protein
LLTDLLQLNVDVIVVVNTRLATAAKRMTQTVPIVVSVGALSRAQVAFWKV